MAPRVSSRSISILMGATIMATFSLASAIAVGRTGTSFAGRTGNSDRSGTTASKSSGAVLAGGIEPLTTQLPTSAVPARDSPPTASSKSSSALPVLPTPTTPPSRTTTPPTTRGTAATPTTTVPAGTLPQGVGVVVMRPDGSDARLVMSTVGRFSWAPDGNHLAVTKAERLVVVAADGSGERTLTKAGNGVSAPLWSPDGTRIAYFDRSSGGLYTIGADGLRPPTLIDAGGGLASWTPDSRLSAVTGDGRLVVYERDGTTRLLASGARTVGPSWAPDGTRVAYMSQGIMMVGADGSGAHAVTSMCCGSETTDSPLTWSPDGRRIAFIDQGDARTVAAEGGAVTVVAAHAASPSWSPDGRQLVAVDQSVTLADGLLNQDVAVMDASGGGRHLVLGPPASLGAVVALWSPAGNRLAVLVGPRNNLPAWLGQPPAAGG